MRDPYEGNALKGGSQELAAARNKAAKLGVARKTVEGLRKPEDGTGVGLNPPLHMGLARVVPLKGPRT